MALSKGKSMKKARKRGRKLATSKGSEATELAAELAERVKGSDAYSVASDRGAALLDTAKERWDDSDLDKRAAELAERLREADTTQQAVGRARETSEKGMAAVGGWLAAGPLSSKLGVQRRRRWPLLVAGLIGAVAGFVAAQATQRGSTDTIRDELADAADRLAAGGGSASVLADTIRTTLDADPRTAQLEPLDINVADGGTVFVRGTVPPDADQGAIRDVVASVPGVTDVDLQLDSATTSP